jgi:hemoglobin
MDRAKRVLKAEKIRVNPAGETLYARLGGRPGVSTLIKWFYAKVRFEPLLEPIFKAHISKWSEHLEVLIDYWSQMTGGPERYSGGMGRHIFLQLRAEHFTVWLDVWEENCRWLLPEPEATDMIALARGLAEQLQRTTLRPETGARGGG